MPTSPLVNEEIVTAPRSPWQNAYVERLIESIRRECLDHVIVLTAAGLSTILKSYVVYYTASRSRGGFQSRRNTCGQYQNAVTPQG